VPQGQQKLILQSFSMGACVHWVTTGGLKHSQSEPARTLHSSIQKLGSHKFPLKNRSASLPSSRASSPLLTAPPGWVCSLPKRTTGFVALSSSFVPSATCFWVLLTAPLILQLLLPCCCTSTDPLFLVQQASSSHPCHASPGSPHRSWEEKIWTWPTAAPATHTQRHRGNPLVHIY